MFLAHSENLAFNSLRTFMQISSEPPEKVLLFAGEAPQTVVAAFSFKITWLQRLMGYSLRELKVTQSLFQVWILKVTKPIHKIKMHWIGIFHHPNCQLSAALVGSLVQIVDCVHRYSMPTWWRPGILLFKCEVFHISCKYLVDSRGWKGWTTKGQRMAWKIWQPGSERR